MKGRSIKNGDFPDFVDELSYFVTSMKGRSIKNGDDFGAKVDRGLNFDLNERPLN